MKKRHKILLAVALLSATSLYGSDGLMRNKSQIGTKADPVVTKSYVEKRISQLSNLGGSTNNSAQLLTKIEAQEKQIAELLERMENLETEKSTFEIVAVPAGKIIYGKQGSEMIIRSGEGRIIASNAGGVQDVTDGIDLSGGSIAPKNNLLIVPREDGRGIEAIKPMVIMVRGGYTIL